MTCKEAHFASLADNFQHCVIFKTFEILIWNGKQNSLMDPVITGSFEKQSRGPSDVDFSHDRDMLEIFHYLSIKRKCSFYLFVWSFSVFCLMTFSHF